MVLAGNVYRHYKGGRYLVVAVADTHEHNGEKDVVYVSLTYGKYVTRPLQRDSRNQDSWMDYVEWPDGQKRMRFITDDHEPNAEFFKKMFPKEKT